MSDKLITTRSDWLLVAALIALSAIPFAAGVRRLWEIWEGMPITPESARFLDAPVTTALHVVSASVFSILGAFQFAAGVRRRWPGWHRRAGRYLVACGLVSALSGLWMTLTFPRVEGDGVLLDIFRLIFGTAMAASMVLGYLAIRRRDIASHRAWMTRGYALGIGAGTQVVVHFPWLLVGGEPNELARALLLGAGWAINLGVAEWSIYRAMPRKALPRITA